MFLVGQDETVSEAAIASAVHGSLMVALEHSSGLVRARAVKQLSRAMSISAIDAGEQALSASAAEGEDLSPALLRRLHDEDPEVVLAITDSETLVRKVLLRLRSGFGGDGDDDIVDVSDAVYSEMRPVTVASAAATAAVPWLSALSETRPKHPIASSSKVLCGLVRLMAAAASAAGTGKEGSTLMKQAKDSALSLFLECLPGPHATTRVKLAQQQASAIVSSSGEVPDEDEAAAVEAAGAAGKACKKALRSVGRVAIEAVSGFCGTTADDGITTLFAGFGKLLSEEDTGKSKGSKSPGRKGKKSIGDVDAMEVEGSGKSKGLKLMGEEVCNSIAASVVEGSKMQELQVR